MIVVLGTYLAFTKDVPFRTYREVQAVFRTSNLLAERSPVRIAGVDVGKVVQRRALRDTDLASLVIDDAGRRRSTATRRSRSARGCSSRATSTSTSARARRRAGELDDGDVIPVAQTSTPVQLDQVLTALQSDTRGALQQAVQGFGDALGGSRAPPTTPTRTRRCAASPAARRSARRSSTSPEALRGHREGHRRPARASEPGRPRPHRRRLRPRRCARWPQQERAARAAWSPTSTPRSATFAAHAGRRCAQPSRGSGRPTAGARTAFASLRAAPPPTRQFARDLTAGLPELPAHDRRRAAVAAQAAPLLADASSAGCSTSCSPATADLAALGDATRRWLPRIDAFNRCITGVLLPTGNLKVDDGAQSAGVENYKEFWYAMVGRRARARASTATARCCACRPPAGRTIIKTGKTNYQQEPLLRASRRCRRCATAPGVPQPAAAAAPRPRRATSTGARRQRPRVARPGRRLAPDAPAPTPRIVGLGSSRPPCQLRGDGG